MIVTCPKCETKFDIPDDKYRPGRKARCSHCGNVFVLPELDDAGAPESAAPPDMAADAAPENSLPEDAASFDATQPEGVMPPPPASVDDVVPPPRAAKGAAKKRGVKKLLLFFGILFVAALLGYGALMVYSAFFPSLPTDSEKAADDSAVESLGGRTGGADQEKEAARLAAVSRLSLENVRQYVVTENEKTGPMVVVEGSVVNNFETPKDLVLLEITLYDERGSALIVREQYCGVSLSLLQLRTLPQAAIEGALVNQSVIIANNTDILPGSGVSFTSVFFNLPQSAYEFEVKIVDVQDPAAKK